MKLRVKGVSILKDVSLNASSRAPACRLSTGKAGTGRQSRGEGLCQYSLPLANKKQESRKLKASTLIEVLVASVLIIVVFTIASLTLNNVFKSTLRSNTQAIDTRINKLIYLYQHSKIDAKHQENFKDWNISFSQQTENNTTFVVAEATNSTTKKTISKKVIHEGTQ